MLVWNGLWKVVLFARAHHRRGGVLFVLGSRAAAREEEETRRQTALLIQEIDAHKPPTRIAGAPRGRRVRHLAKEPLCRRLSHELRSPR